MTKFVAQEQQEQNIKTRTAAKRIACFTIVAIAVAVLAVSTAVYEQGGYSPKSPRIATGITPRCLLAKPLNFTKYSRE